MIMSQSEKHEKLGRYGDPIANSNWTTCEVDYRIKGQSEEEKGREGKLGGRRQGWEKRRRGVRRRKRQQ